MSSSPTDSNPAPRRIQAVVALRLLEVMRDMDLPVELLRDEDPTRTIPRRFGLSDVVERQIRTHREDVRKGVRITDEDVRGLFRFVIRRPDGAQVFERVGRLLAEEAGHSRLVRFLPASIQYRMARRRARRTLKKLFGRAMGAFGRGPFVLAGQSLLFVEADPGGDACQLVSGFTEEVMSRTMGAPATVEHTLCEARGDSLCQWEGELTDAPAELDLQEAPEDDELPDASSAVVDGAVS